MAEVLPFRGLVYNPLKISKLADVISPPFDVISEKEQETFHQRSDYNMVRLILGKKTVQDTDQDHPHTRAARCLEIWRNDHILVKDPAPAFYLTELHFDYQGRRVTRRGLVGLVRLVHFDKGVVMPHEKTFTKVKSERLGLMKHCHTNFSPIFAVYDDTGFKVTEVIENVVRNAPDFQFTDHGGFGHRLWRIQDPNQHGVITSSMHDKNMVIADGHHRYETALNYRNWVAATEDQFHSKHPANYVMMYLTSVQDPGLMILPAHRLLKDVPASALRSFEQKAAEFFDIQKFPPQPERVKGDLADFMNQLRGEAGRHAIGVYLKTPPALMLLTLKPGVGSRQLASVKSETLRRMDVTVLTELVFLKTLGFDRDRLDDENRIGYTVRAVEAVDAVNQGLYDAAFLLNPTTVDQVCRVAAEGEVMPRKATYFYPKVTTGLVMNLLKTD